MREILFRGQDIKTQKWVEGYLYIRHDGVYEIGSYNEDFNIERCTHDAIPETIGQYTGLTDKNGNRIFEGDICKINSIGRNVICTIVFRKGFFVADEGKGSIINCGIGTYKNSCIKVIGNIHDNPELLEDN